MDNIQSKSKKWIFWAMMVAGILYFLSVPVGYFENNSISIRDLILSLVLIGFAFAYKIQQKI